MRDSIPRWLPKRPSAEAGVPGPLRPHRRHPATVLALAVALTARNLELGVPMVTAFHATRMAALVLCIGSVYRLSGRVRRRVLGG